PQLVKQGARPAPGRLVADAVPRVAAVLPAVRLAVVLGRDALVAELGDLAGVVARVLLSRGALGPQTADRGARVVRALEAAVAEELAASEATAVDRPDARRGGPAALQAEHLAVEVRLVAALVAPHDLGAGAIRQPLLPGEAVAEAAAGVARSERARQP